MWRGLPNGMGVKLALGLCVLLLSARQSIAQYQCGDPTDGGHCYGTAFWRERLNYAGASTTISQVPMGCPSGCDGFINNEMWLVDYDTTACKDSLHGACWVEVGYQFLQNGDSKVFFWADNRPPTQGVYLGGAILGPVGENDPIGSNASYTIIRDDRDGVPPGTYQVYILNDFGTTRYGATSVGDPFSPDTIIIGTELAGVPANASVEAFDGNRFRSASFRNNIWAHFGLICCSGSNSGWTLQRDKGSTQSSNISTNPPFSHWEVAPGILPNDLGGIFVTRCCAGSANE